MRKTVWKLAPYEPFEVDAIAGWLDEMSQKGLQFTSKWGPFCRFERSPSPARYRVDPGRIMLDPTEEERIDAYRHFGWEYCSPYTRYADVYRAEDPSAPELHTDNDLLDGLVKHSFRGHFWLFLHFALAYVNAAILTDGFSWLSQSYDPAYLPLTLLVFSSLLLLVLFIGLTVSTWLRLKRHPETDIHTPQRLRRGMCWRTFRLTLGIISVLSWGACLLQLILFL